MKDNVVVSDTKTRRNLKIEDKDGDEGAEDVLN